MQVDLAEITGAIAGISLAALGLGVVTVLPRRVSAIYAADLADSPAGPGPARQDSLQKILFKYSTVSLGQSRISFVVSIVFASLGFLVILSGVAVVVFKLGTLTAAAIPALSGTVVEAVAGLFFAINGRTQKVMLEFHGKLRSDQRVEQAIEIAANLPDSQMSSSLQVRLALLLMEAAGDADAFRPVPDDAGGAAGRPPRLADLMPQPRGEADLGGG